MAASIASIVWTAISSTTAVIIGLSTGSVVLVAFGAVGGFDLVGSVALVTHFQHALRHEEISERRERLAQLLVSWGLMLVGLATIGASADRLSTEARSSEPLAGIVVSAASIVVLGYLGVRKHRIGARIPSPALMTDGWLSLTGCGTAICAVAGLALDRATGRSWIDPAAALVIAATAVTLAVVSLRRAAKIR